MYIEYASFFIKGTSGYIRNMVSGNRNITAAYTIMGIIDTDTMVDRIRTGATMTFLTSMTRVQQPQNIIVI